MCFKKGYFLAAVVVVMILNSCKKWDDPITVNNPDLSLNLSDAILSNSNLSSFSDYIKKTGVDVLLQSSKTYTVWAPSNDALKSLDPAIVNDTARLRSFVLNHIANQSFFARDIQTTTRVPMLNGKYNNFFSNRFEDANLLAADRFVSNGVLHVIDKAMLVLPSIWDFINGTRSQYAQNNFIAGLNFNSFDPSLAIIDSISFITGLPVYRPGTGLVVRNSFTDRVSDVKREDKQYTYFVIADAGFGSKTDSLKPYFRSNSTTATDSLARWNVVKDLIVDTLYPNAASLPNTLTSKFGIVMPINKALIIDTRKVSNGIVYVMASSGIPTFSKFQQIIVQGENPSGFQSDKTGNTNYRIKRNPVTGLNFSDLLVSGHGVTGYYAYYRLNEIPSIKYNIYALAVNDFQAANVFQSLVFNYFVPPSTFTALTTTPTPLNYAVPLSSAAGAYSEVLLGSVSTTLYGTLDIRLTSGGATLGSAGTAPIVLDYIKLVPVP